MATFPEGVRVFREKENLPGVVFDPNNKKTLYANDMIALEEEVRAIETTLLTPAGRRMPIVGTGFPNGVVTAPVGAKYIDTNVSNGASSWIKKSGTGNTGWQVLEGDTGWRAVGSSVLNGWSSSAIGLKIRRLNGTVYIEAGSGGPNGAAKTNQIFYTPPEGFKPFILPQYAVVAAASESGTTVMKRVLRNNSSFECESITNILFSAGYPTNDAWPTTLPGTAV